MDLREAVNHAISVVVDLFADQEISDVGLEEVDASNTDRIWRITVGFYRPWDNKPSNALAALALSKDKQLRTYKVVGINMDDGSLAYIRNR